MEPLKKTFAVYFNKIENASKFASAFFLVIALTVAIAESNLDGRTKAPLALIIVAACAAFREIERRGGVE